MNISIIGACQTLGSSCDGAQYGPDSLRNNGLLNRLKRYGISINDVGNIYNDDKNICQPNEKLRSYEKIADFNNRLARIVSRCLNNDNFPLVIGGDHSLGIGSINGVARALGGDNLCVIWVDAHTDINTQETTPTGNIHGMTLASVLGLGNEQLSSICGLGAKIKAENIIYVASRDIDEGESEIIKQHNIQVFHMDELITNGINKTVKSIEEHLNSLKISNIYLSIDIDVIDPKLAPGTGVPVPNGLTKEAVFKVIDVIAGTGKVKGAELVEVNPTLDDDNNTTSQLAVEIIDYLIGRIINSYNG